MSLKTAVKRLSRALLRPFAQQPLAPALPYSTGDVAAIGASTDVVTAIFSRPQAEKMGQALGKFLGHDESHMAIRKDVNATVENCMRRLALREDPPVSPWFDGFTPPEGRHPYDSVCAEALRARGVLGAEVVVPRLTRGERARHVASAVLNGLVFIVEAVKVVLRYGTRSVKTKRYSVLCSIPLGDRRWFPVIEEARRQGLSDGQDFAYVFLGTATVPSDRYPVFVASELAVPVGAWVRDVIVPGMALFLKGVVALARRPTDSLSVEIVFETYRQALLSLPMWRVRFNFSAVTLLENMEYDSRHILASAVLSTNGIRLVRFQTTQFDVPGSVLSYQKYDINLSGGSYQADYYGDTWSKNLVDKRVGLLTMDRRYGEDSPNLADQWKNRIEERLNRGEKMIVFFGQGSTPQFQSIYPQPLIETWPLVREAEDWFLVFKPKQLKGAIKDRLDADPKMEGWRGSSKFIEIVYPSTGDEVCPTSWLLQKMKFGLGYGSVQVEALAHGKKVFTFYPVLMQTPLQKRLVSWNLLHDDPESLRRAVEIEMGAGHNPEPDFDWIKRSFEPYGDHRALDRAVAPIWGRLE